MATSRKTPQTQSAGKRVRWPVVTMTSKSITTLAADGSATGMAPDVEGTKTTLTADYNANNTITAYCHALLNTQLLWDPNTQGVKPEWFINLEKGLIVAQSHADIWLTGTPSPPGGGPATPPLGPTVFATVPQTIIDYGNLFIPATDMILGILASLPQNVPPTAAQQAEINQLIDVLLLELRRQQATLTDVQNQLTTFATDVQEDNTTLVTGQNNAVDALRIEQQEMVTIQAQINAVTVQIQVDSQAALASEIGLGIGIFMVVVGVALAVATGGAATPLVVGGIGVVVVGVSIAGTVIFSKKVNEDLQELYRLQSELSYEQRQATAVTGIINSVTALVTANESAQQAISEVLNMWSVLEGKLQSVVTDLKGAEAAQVPAIIEALRLHAAQTAWAQLVDFCIYIQTNTVTVQPAIVQPGLTSPSSFSAAA